MTPHSNHNKPVSIQFNSLQALNNFKKECHCNDFYINREAIALVGIFDDNHLQLATLKYNALVKVDRNEAT